MKTPDPIADRIRAAGLRPLECRSSYANSANATRTMEGLTHYYDADTLRFFGSRVTDSRLSPCGVFFGTISTQKRGFEPSSGREYRIAIHDLTGECVHRTDPDTFATRRQAVKAFEAAWSALDEAAGLTAAIERETRDLARRLAALTGANA